MIYKHWIINTELHVLVFVELVHFHKASLFINIVELFL